MALAVSVKKSEDFACCFRSINKNGVRVLWEITKNCNMNCLSCMAKKKAGNELSTSECKKIISQMPEMNIQKVLFSGGEPLMRRDIFELIKETIQQGIHTVLCTNATPINEEVVAKLKNTGLRDLNIGLDGSTKESYRKIRQNDSFEKVINAIKLLKKEDFELDLTCVASKANANEVGKVIDLAFELGANSITINNLFMKDNAIKNWDKLKMNYNDYAKVVNTVLEKRKDYKKKLPIRTLRLIKTSPLEPCGAAKSVAFIDPSGRMYPCSLLVNNSNLNNDLRTERIQNIFDSKYFNEVRNNIRNPKICTSCNKRDECGFGCRGFVQTFQNNFYKTDPLCNMSH